MTNRIRRALAPTAIAVLAVLGAAPSAVLAQNVPAAGATDLVPAEKLFDKHLEAIGGKEKVLAVKFMHSKASMEIPAAGMNMSMEIWQSAPNRIRMSVTIPGMGAMDQGYDGTTGWMMSPMTGPMLLEGGTLEDMKQQATMGRDAKWREVYASVETTGKADFNGKTCYVVKATTKGGSEQMLYFDAESGLQQGFRAKQTTDMGEVEAETVFKAWKEYEGVKMPVEIEVKLPAMGMTQVLKMSEITFDEIPAEKFELPEMIRKLKEAQTPPASPSPMGTGG